MSKTKPSGPGHYEVLFIIANEYTEEEAKKISQDIEGIISKYKGEITYKEFWGKKKLAYPIKHNHFGYYSLLEFDLETESLPELNENLRLSDKIIRFQIIKIKKRTLEEINAEKAKQEALNKNKGDKGESDNKEEKPKKESAEKKLNKDELEDANETKEEKAGDEKKEDNEENKTKEKEEKEEVKKEDEEKKSEKENEESLKDFDDKLDNILDSQDLIK
ncbi:30S ribosomal protein S6 [Patescibacteria group bacterium]|nr:30S ribosomal protein S6 [Patescibacteria group bacterium]